GSEERCARFGWTPTNARVQSLEAVRILNCQRSLPDAAHALHRSAAHRHLRHGSGLVLHQDAVKLVEFLYAACEAGDARRHTNEMSRWPLQRLGTPLHSGKDTAPTLLCVPNANKVLIDVGRE